ncbi:anhydro-N-acetylmuramic acid kinase [Hoeflea prorocentri]|uniref:Anhydro-N-acetylmuramic acid kinase n=1 Tax=Hoeflea prorocentri TaxID=1922333 RepID=A0A9X3UFY8_9HYPH|nr:anhydro-N-acetylmuramic acid kinase [Hoeflea prorocentri]MCY6380628.1 anhydro-N-acetylmuramic acid kinase [Hoeflea prorocentri]MDA5398428.1 anhydro-N-acetylmuramic acid kinase [Hoeflea prorocentri]
MSTRIAGKAEVLTAIGLMSGTSMDGIDVALVRSDGEQVVERGAFLTIPYRPDFRRRLADALEAAKSIRERDERPDDLGNLERELTHLHVDAVETYLSRFGLTPDQVDLVGFHGQTVLHRPERGLTVQIGDGSLLAERIGIPVVYDMRANDMKAGGEGAPLAPAYHGALAKGLTCDWPVAFVNIGGISNITSVDADGQLTAFDTGPGNSLIDQWVEMKAGIPFDQGGAIASEGQVLRRLIDPYLEAAFFDVSSKRRSLDRNDFLPPDPDEAGLEDGSRSLARLTAEALLKSAQKLPEIPKTWIICGGGRSNRIIMDDLQDLVTPSSGSVLPAEDLDLDGDGMEAEAWAFLAIRSHLGLALSWPGTTGCRQPVTGGKIAKPSRKVEAG